MGLSKLMFQILLRKMGTRRLFERAAEARRRELSASLAPILGNTVLGGPFEGMTISRETSWGHDDWLSKIAGAYEAELQAPILRAVERAPSVVINVGCAEGYYTIGLARLLPNAAVYAFDTDPEARAICAKMAEENGIASRLTISGRCTPPDLSRLTALCSRVLVVMDCEGAEIELLDPQKVPSLAHSDIIVETHDFCAPRATETLQGRLWPTHEVFRISQGARNPHEVGALSTLFELERWLMISETRAEVATWLACWAPI